MERTATQQLRKDLLYWYDQHGRHLPWRAKLPNLPNPYHVWLSEMMLQQTTVVTVLPFFKSFIKKWPTLSDLSQATQDEVLIAWQGLGYYARARNLHTCAQIVRQNHGGMIPQTTEDLIRLPGIGPYMSAAIAAIAFDQPVVPVDGNVIRVLTRLYSLKKALPRVKEEITSLAAAFAHPRRPGDFAQALMDLGATICLPKNPQCHMCPWQTKCLAFQHDTPEDYPVKELKKNRPTRYATAFVIINTKNQILLRKRPGKGLLAGLYEVPTTDWSEKQEEIATQRSEFLKTIPHNYKGHVKHTFTHFHLAMDVYLITCKACQPKVGEIWVGLHELDKFALSTLMKRVITEGIRDIISSD